MATRTSTWILLLIAALAASPVAAQPPERPAPEPAPQRDPAPEEDPLLDAALMAAGEEVIEIVEQIPPGSAHTVDAEALERFEHDDVHKILAAVPGVYIREEDGYGLRPNIGMRGTGSERSAKIALLEDGIPIAPAPYSAPAAYYFPLVTRMAAVEVVKGPSAIKHGPNTVGGAVNLVTRAIPAEQQVTVDVAGGADVYGKAHASYGDSTPHFGWLAEGVKLRTDGFKQLDGGGDTGFDKNEAMLKLRANTGASGSAHHQLDVKLGYADEISHETYTGLTDADFDANPYRRYRATALDRMDWTHWQAQVAHRVRVWSKIDLTTRAYRQQFARDWRKLNGFNSADVTLAEILADPDSGNNAIYYSVLTGDSDSASPSEALIIGTNAREFVSQGVQTVARLERDWLGWAHAIEAGTRLHYDEAKRHHFEDAFVMAGGALAPAGGPPLDTRDTLGSTLAWSAHYHHKVAFGAVSVSGGVRTEVIATEHRDHMDASLDADETRVIVLPGGGVVYQALPSLGLLAGVHRGFVPVSPGQGTGVDPEESINYEAGFRWSGAGAAVETVGFFSDYSNLLGTCTFSSGCMTEQVDDEFNGGRVWSYGAELLAAGAIAAGPMRIPWRLGYTLQHSEFRTSFQSDNPQWGEVARGDELPYLPEHLVHAEAGVAGASWEVSLGARYATAMRDVAGQGDAAPTELTDDALVLDAAARYRVGPWGTGYVTIDNLLDESHITSRRPFGARPGVPRLIVVGYKNTF
jgi:Fe(3+) dicitrate transport protein